MEILVLSHSAPYDTVGTAGEKTHNFYLKAMKEAGNSVRLISFCDSSAHKKLDLDKYQIKNKVFIENNSGISGKFRKIKRALRIIFCPHDNYGNFISKERRKKVCSVLKEYKFTKYQPDCIILEWTHMILMVDLVKLFFPKAKIVASSHDVNYIGSMRYWMYERNKLVKYFRKRQYLNLKRCEVTALSKCDLIVPQNMNDIKIFQQSKLLANKEFFRIVPYYDDYSDNTRDSISNTIVFYGAMGRSENYLSVQWFIENVFNKLTDYDFIIIGGGATEAVRKYESEHIKVTGFLPLEEIKDYFTQCKCMVVPLQLGSGIKVKVLEAFSAGIPVLTNSLGIEGIYAHDKTEYIHCESAEDYIDVLNKAMDSKLDLESIGQAAKKFVKENHSLKHSKDAYIKKLVELCLGRS